MPYAPLQLFALVGDVALYPRFIPWITDMRVSNRRELADGVVLLDAEASVRFAIVRERFATRVRLDPTALTIDVSLISGPFRRLTNRWSFQPAPAGGELTFEIDFEFGSRLLQGLLSANFERAVSRLIGCFEGRARDLYGPERPAALP